MLDAYSCKLAIDESRTLSFDNIVHSMSDEMLFNYDVSSFESNADVSFTAFSTLFTDTAASSLKDVILLCKLLDTTAIPADVAV